MPIAFRPSHLAVLVLCALAMPFAASAASLGASEEPGFRIGLICAGSTSDGGWNQLAKDALESVKKEMGAKVSTVQKVSSDKAGDEMRAFIADGYDIVFAHGYEFLNPAAEVAKAGGKTKLAVSGADAAKPGIVTVDFDLSQASYQIGMLAARLSASGKLGFIGGSRIPSVEACYRGFQAGALSVRKDASVVFTITSWDQPEKSKAQAEALLGDGVDAIYHDVDAASRGIFEAIKEHNAKQPDAPAWVFGSCADQNGNPVCPEATPASAVIRLDATFLRIAKAVKAGTFAPGLVREDIAAGTCVIVFNPKLIGKPITPAMQAEIEAAGTKLASGALKVPEK